MEVYKGNKINTNCPFCHTRGKTHDTNMHFYIYVSTNSYHCFRCGATGTFKNSTAVEDLTILSSKNGISDDLTLMRDRINGAGTIKEANETLDLHSISREVSKESTPFAYDYLERRDLVKYIDKYNIKVGVKNYETNVWEGRILFPYIMNSEVKYVIGRTYTDRKPKYRNTPGYKSYVLYGYDTINDDKCIICEGVISSIRAMEHTGVSAVAVLGKTISDYHIMLLSMKVSTVYLSLDADVPRTHIRIIATRLKRYFDKVFIVSLPNGDPDDLGAEYNTYFNSAQPI